MHQNAVLCLNELKTAVTVKRLARGTAGTMVTIILSFFHNVLKGNLPLSLRVSH